MKKILVGLFVLLVLNFCTTAFIDWVKNPELTQMEIFLRTPEHFLWDFTKKP